MYGHFFKLKVKIYIRKPPQEKARKDLDMDKLVDSPHMSIMYLQILVLVL